MNGNQNYNENGTPNGQHYDPNAQYGSPNGQYYNQNGQYGAPNGQYYDPNAQYGAQNGQYHDPNAQYGAPNGQYYNQNGQYGAPNGQYYSQNGQYGAPNGQYYNQNQYGNQNFGTQNLGFGPAGGYSGMPFPPEGRIEIITHVLLLLLTFGIWYLIWIYKTTKYLNYCPGEEYRNPTTKLLLCMFVPFYYIYWVYKSSQRIDKMSAMRGVPSDTATVNLIIALFIGIIPPILMQNKINDLTK